MERNKISIDTTIATIGKCSAEENFLNLTYENSIAILERY